MIIDEALVSQLISAQFPEWANLDIQRVEPGGWDNRTFRLGHDLLVRMPSAAVYALKVEKEQEWLPKLAPHLPLPIPQPLAMGQPGCGYPWCWSIYRWIDGETAAVGAISDPSIFASDLAAFLKALQRIDTTGGLAAGAHNFYRGGSLKVYDTETRQAIDLLQDHIDVVAVTAIWEAALASVWDKKPVWVHGDVSVGNLLVQNGQLSGVIDFGGLGVGDPACDLVMAWTFFTGEARIALQKASGLDAATWTRARGWALWKALIVAAGLSKSNVYETEQSWRVIVEVLK